MPEHYEEMAKKMRGSKKMGKGGMKPKMSKSEMAKKMKEHKME